MATVLFFTAANLLYEPFVVPYAVSVLHHNPDSVVEVCIEDTDRFRAAYADALAVVSRHFPDRLVLRGGQFGGLKVTSPRFLETPSVHYEYTYIGDIDILILEPRVAARHLEHMARTGLPYSNILRPNKPRLSGLHFTRTDAHYPIVMPSDWDFGTGNTEELLYRFIVEKGLPLPDPADTFRPTHGIHLSIKRTPTRAPAAGPPWRVARYHVKPYLALWEVPAWREVAVHFHPAYRALLMVLEATIQASDSDRLIYRRREAVALWRKLAVEGVAPAITPPQTVIDEIGPDGAEASEYRAREAQTAEVLLEASQRLAQIDALLLRFDQRLPSQKKARKARSELENAQRELAQVRNDVGKARLMLAQPVQPSARVLPGGPSGDSRLKLDH